MGYTGKKIETKLYDTYTKDETDTKVDTKVNTSDIQTLVETYSPPTTLSSLGLENHDDLTVDVNGKIAQTSVNALDTALAGKLDVAGDGSQLTGLAASFADLTDTTVSTVDPTISENPSAVGHLWLNSTTGELFTCTDNTAGVNFWGNLGEGAGGVTPYEWYNASGGAVTTDGDYKYHVFTTSGTFTINTAANALATSTGGALEVLVVAGGGGGGQNGGGGGGAGGVIYATGLSKTAGSYGITIGGGGAKGTCSGCPGSQGASSSGLGISTVGGGGGDSRDGGSASTGGSGGGGCSGSSGANGTAGQGNSGGNSAGGGCEATGGGGGGKVSAGSYGANNSPGTGGNGGTYLTYAVGGGGAGGNTCSTYNIAGGFGGGGNTSTAGTVNTGGGGGGHNANTGGSGNGGSGLVVIKYKFQ